MDSKILWYLGSMFAMAVFTVLMGAKMLPKENPETFQIEEVLFDVTQYGANGDGFHDNKKAFLSAWVDACGATEPARIIIPNGNYVVSAVSFHGYCDQPITMQIDGQLYAPIQNETVCVGRKSKYWLRFNSVDHLIVRGKGTLHGNGESWWHSNKCRYRPVSLRLSRCRNSVVKELQIVDSKKGHISLNDCGNVVLEDLSISAPSSSDNTVGIHIEQSRWITVRGTEISTGDDCVSIGPDTRDILIERVECGPGHGISVGGLGHRRDTREARILANGEFMNGGVRNITVREIGLTGTENGIRIKTWQGNTEQHTSAVGIYFENINMYRVKNPIIIDQHYCPHSFASFCANNPGTGVEIREITYKNIRGRSLTSVAINFDCSAEVPCQDIVLEDVIIQPSLDDDDEQQIESDNSATVLSSHCGNAHVTSVGSIEPPVCL